MTASSLFRHGPSPALACRSDQRFSYCLYIPARLQPDSADILVAVHGSERANQDYRDGFAALAERAGLVVLAPLFPCGVAEAEDMDGYKYMRLAGIRFDQVLLAMVDEVRARYALPSRRLLMFGFSGGAHFAHRFLYLHPGALAAVSICAPGTPTLPDTGAPCWRGVADMQQQYGATLDLEAMARVSIHLAVGEHDTGPVPEPPGWAMASATRVPAIAPAGNRIDRLRALADGLHAQQVPSQFELVPGAGHQRAPLQACAASFFAHHLGIDHAPHTAN